MLRFNVLLLSLLGHFWVLHWPPLEGVKRPKTVRINLQKNQLARSVSEHSKPVFEKRVTPKIPAAGQEKKHRMPEAPKASPPRQPVADPVEPEVAGPLQVLDLEAAQDLLVDGGYVHPQYPKLAARRRQTGRVLLQVVVEDGVIRELGVAESSGIASLDDAAYAAVQNWQFRPISARFQPLVRFEMEE